MNDKRTSRPYLDFYAKHNVSPVLNEMASADHFAQRAALYRHLNVLRNSVSGKAVLEFGPGNGINSLYTMSLNPRKYDLVDANQTGIENCRKNLSSAFPDKAFSLIESDIQDPWSLINLGLLMIGGDAECNISRLLRSKS